MQAFLQHRSLLIFFIAWGVFNLFVNNHAISLWDQDEAAYAGFAHTMIKTGHWTVPEFLWSEPHRKTPLHFWAIAGSFYLFGENEFAVRFPSAVAIVGVCALLWYFGGLVFGATLGRMAAVLMLCSIFFPNLAKISVTDALLIFFETLAALALLRFVQRPALWNSLLVGVGVAGGLLVKGPPVLILVVGMIGVLAVLHPHRLRLLRPDLLLFLLVGFVPIYAWGRAAWLTDNGAYIRWMIDWYILKRASGETVFGQWGPPGYYLLLFLLSFLPFAWFFPKAVVGFLQTLRDAIIGCLLPGVLLPAAWRERAAQARAYFKTATTNEEANMRIFVLAWLSAGWVVYEILPSKLPAYAMGAAPGMAIWLAFVIGQTTPDQLASLRYGRFFYVFFTILIALALPIAAFLLLDVWGIVAASLTSFCWLAAAGLLWRAYRAQQLDKMLRLGVIQALVFVLLAWVLIVPSFEQPRSATKRIAQTIQQLSPNADPVVLHIPYDLPSLPFYLTQLPKTYIPTPKGELDTVITYLQDDKAYVFVFNQERLSALQEALKLQGKTLPYPVFTVQGWVSDMGKLIDYKIVYKSKMMQQKNP